MPYSKVEGHSECSDGEIAVVKDEDGELMGCHASDEAADEQITALQISEAEKAMSGLQDLLSELKGEAGTQGDPTVKGAQLGRMIRSARERAEMSREDLAEEMSGDGARAASTIGQIERAEIDGVPDEVLRELATRLPGLSFADLEQARDAGVAARGHDVTSPLVAPGDTIKDLSDDGLFGGFLVVHGSKDLEGEIFTPDTDYWLPEGEGKTFALYGHGQDPELGKRRIGEGTLVVKDAGVWMEAQLERRNEYEEKIQELARRGKLGLSSGTAAHLVEKEAVEGKSETRITQWPLGLDASLTPEPAEPRTKIRPLKNVTVPPVKDLSAEGGEVLRQLDDMIKTIDSSRRNGGARSGETEQKERELLNQLDSLNEQLDCHA